MKRKNDIKGSLNLDQALVRIEEELDLLYKAIDGLSKPEKPAKPLPPPKPKPKPAEKPKPKK